MGQGESQGSASRLEDLSTLQWRGGVRGRGGHWVQAQGWGQGYARGPQSGRRLGLGLGTLTLSSGSRARVWAQFARLAAHPNLDDALAARRESELDPLGT